MEISTVRETSYTLLYSAVFRGDLNTVKQLLLQGADINAINEFNNSVLHVAVFRGDLNMVNQLLLQGADISATNELNNSVLHVAVFRDDPNMVEQLLLQGADINATNKFNNSALHIAVKEVQLQCVKVLLNYYCDVNLQDSNGETALHLAIDSKNTDLINLFCDCERVDFMLQRTKKCSEEAGNIRALLNNLKNKDGFTALHLAAFSMAPGREISAILLSQHVPATIDLSDNDRQTPLHIATTEQDWSLVELLVRHDADISKADCFGDTVLHNAILILRDCATNIPKNRKDSPFIYAIWQNLAKQGAKTELALACFLVSVDKSGKLLEHTKNRRNQTPLDVMKSLIDSAEFPRCADLLRSYNYYSHLGVTNSLGLMEYLRTREIM